MRRRPPLSHRPSPWTRPRVQGGRARTKMHEPFLELRDIGKSYPGVRALDGVSLAVVPGEVVGLIGENGAGKSTLMKVLGGVVAPDSGSIVIDGTARPALTVNE